MSGNANDTSVTDPQSPPGSPTLSWRRRELDEILRLVRAFPVLIVGGRGLGKTTFLQMVHADLSQRQRVWRIEGRKTTDARAAILDPKRAHTVGVIDDLDVLCTAGRDDDRTALMQLEAGLWSLLSESPGLATVSIGPASPSIERVGENIADTSLRRDWINAYSRLTMHLQVYYLDPWNLRWKADWDAFFSREFSRSLKPASLLELWRTEILQLTGGHPALAGPMVERLDWLCASDEKPEEITPFESSLVHRQGFKADSSEALELRASIVRYIEDYLARTGLRRIARALRQLRDSSNPLERESFEALVLMARQSTDGVAVPPDEGYVRQILLNEGLVYKDHQSGQLVIPGSIIRTQIVGTAAMRGTEARSVVLTPDPSDAESGTMVVRAGAEERRIELSGAPWKVLRVLYAQRGETLSVAVLQKLANLGDDRAVKNAVQRLQQKLRVYDLAHVVVNEYGKGYRLAPIT